jgi:iron-sulfur cluster assembly protein
MITLTQEAAEKVQEILAAHAEFEDPGMRISLTDGGCSGMKYHLDIADGCGDDDSVVEAFGARLFVAKECESRLDSLVIDFEAGVMNSGFKFHNPKATRTCGCGESFAV